MAKKLHKRIEKALVETRDFDSFVHGLLGEVLGWPIEQRVAEPDAIGWSWTAEELEAEGLDEKIVDGQVWQIQPLAPHRQPWGIFLLEFRNEDVFTRGSGMVGPLRRVLRGLVPRKRRDPTLPYWQHENILFIATHAYRHFTFAHFRGAKAASANLSTFGWTRGQPGLRTLSEFNLPSLTWPEDHTDRAAWHEHWTAAFDKEELTKRFFKQFRALCSVVAADIAERNAWIADEQHANAEAQIFLERMLFLYFIQRKGWLNQTPNYLVAEFNDKHRGNDDEATYTQRFLNVVFARLSSRDMRREQEIGHLPFLNGGLFEDDPLSLDEAGANRRALRVGNGVMARVFNDLLERYNFTIREDTPLDQDVAVDPEMLGKILECLVLEMESAVGAPDRRKATGSYYTPRIVVHFICREVLRQYLLARLPGDGWEQRLERLFAIDASDGISADEQQTLREVLTPQDAERVRVIVREIKACDPAVGSGAFAVGLLHELTNLCVLCETRERGKDPRTAEGSNYLFDLKLHFIQNAIYGVDILERAVEICKLRLWLSLIVDYQLRVDPFNCTQAQFASALAQLPPLPNLDFKIRRGDSLLDQLHGHPFLMAEVARDQRARDIIDEMRELKRQFFPTDSVLSKRALRRKLLERKLDLAEHFLKQRLKPQVAVQDDLIVLDDQGSRKRRAGETEKRRRRAEEKRQLQAALADVERTRAELATVKPGRGSLSLADEERLRQLEGQTGDRLSFVWHLDFMEVFNRPQAVSTFTGEFAFADQPGVQREFEVATTAPSGFDIIVGNPPFVTCRDPERRERYRERWPTVCYRTYQLVSPFFQSAFGLLSREGHLGFIVSNAFARRDFGKPLIEDFFPTVRLKKIVDCSGLMFPGHGTPTCIVFGTGDAPGTNATTRVAAILPGGGDLRTPPERSPLWHTLAREHDNPGYVDDRVIVSERDQQELASWPWQFDVMAEPTRQEMEDSCTATLSLFLAQPIGRIFCTSANDIYLLSPHVARRARIDRDKLVPFSHGQEIRDWQVFGGTLVVKPYDEQWELLPLSALQNTATWLTRFRWRLGARRDFSGVSYEEAGRPWYEFHQLDPSKVPSPSALVFPLISTHCHFVLVNGPRLTERHGQVTKLKSHSEDPWHLVAGLANSSAALFWIKQVCFSKRESERPELDTYYEFQGGKVELLPMPPSVANQLSEAMVGTPRDHERLLCRLSTLARVCRGRGRQLNRLAMGKLFEKRGEAYLAWHQDVVGYEEPDESLAQPFCTADGLRALRTQAQHRRDELGREMVALQEEMDWVVYLLYGLASGHVVDGGQDQDTPPEGIERKERPFVLWAAAGSDFGRAVALIPTRWSAERQALWRRRLEAIRDNEHVRRIEQPVYKRRWDEQWKVGGGWECGLVAYDHEFVEAYEWWMREKAEWWLEHKKGGGPVELDEWTAALWEDPRVQAAWPVAAETYGRIALAKKLRKDADGEVTDADIEAAWQAQEAKRRKQADTEGTLAGLAPMPVAFRKRFKQIIDAETVPVGWPAAMPYDDLAALKGVKKVPGAIRRIRGKLNVPRERFRKQPPRGPYVWAGLDLFEDRSR